MTQSWKTFNVLALTIGIALAPTRFLQGQAKPASTAPAKLVAEVKAAGATHVNVRQRSDGGILLHGRLEGRDFVIDVPPGWQGPAALFASGYNFPGVPMVIPKDPVDLSNKQDPWGGFPTAIYKQGYAVGQTVYDKTGVAIESATLNNVRLKRVLDQIGATRVLMTGESMGGSVVLSVIDQNPGLFAGALTACGVTDNWSDQVGTVVDMRAAYDYFTANTKYGLPGSKDLNRDAVNPIAPRWLSPVKLLYFGLQAKRVTTSINKLFADAKKDPNGQAGQIVRNIASAADSKPDIGSFTFRLLVATLGIDDIRETYSGNIYGNRAKVYHADALSEAENSTLNLDITRVDADPAAVTKAIKWHASTGRMTTPTVTMHNRYDALVPYSAAIGLGRKVSSAGNEAHLLQLAVPAEEGVVILSKARGYTHCGFSATQARYEFGLADEWARTRQKPDIQPDYKP